MKLDIEKWNTARKQLETQIKTTKHSIRKLDKPVMVWQKAGKNEWGHDKHELVPSGATYRGGTWQEYVSLADLKHEVTQLYVLRAGLRGRIHVKEQTLEEAQKVVEFLMDTYGLPELENASEQAA